VFSRIVLVLLTAATVAGVSGCGASDGPTSGTSVIAGFYPLAFLAEQVGGPDVRVDDLTPAGAEPHDLELTARNVRAVRDADLVLYLGDGFQPALERAVSERDGPSLDLLAGQRLVAGSAEGDETSFDPHVWLDPVRFAAMARETAGALGRPAAARELHRRLLALDTRYRTGLRSCARREIVTSHAAFGYLARRYGLRQIALTGLSPETEPGPRDIERLARQVRALGVTTVFFETLVSPRLARTVAREAGVETAVLDPIEGLTGAEQDRGADYVSLMDDNLATLRAALGCP
jgi:zinc transport system substrate-binding protein